MTPRVWLCPSFSVQKAAMSPVARPAGRNDGHRLGSAPECPLRGAVGVSGDGESKQLRVRVQLLWGFFGLSRLQFIISKKYQLSSNLPQIYFGFIYFSTLYWACRAACKPHILVLLIGSIPPDEINRAQNLIWIQNVRVCPRSDSRPGMSSSGRNAWPLCARQSPVTPNPRLPFPGHGRADAQRVRGRRSGDGDDGQAVRGLARTFPQESPTKRTAPSQLFLQPSDLLSVLTPCVQRICSDELRLVCFHLRF